MAAFDQDIKLFVKALDPEAAKLLAELGQQTKTDVEMIQTGRRGIKPLTHIAVDGQAVTDFRTVKPTSVIFEYWDYRSEIIKVAFEECRARSPIGPSGNYRNGFFAMLDGVALEPLQVPTAIQLKGVKLVVITNKLPYARKLEVGRTQGGESFVKTVDPHIVESAAKAVKQEFSGVIWTRFSFVDLPDAYGLKQSWRDIRHRKKGGRGGRSGPRHLRYPAIFLEV